MRDMFLAMTLGNDPHTLGIQNAGRIARMVGLEFASLPPATVDEDKIAAIAANNPRYLGLSYRLSPDKAVPELKKFLALMQAAGLFSQEYAERKMGFAGLSETLAAVHDLQLDRDFGLTLHESRPQIEKTTRDTLAFFGAEHRGDVLAAIVEESQPVEIGLLSQIAQEVVAGEAYRLEPPLPVPDACGRESLVARMAQSPFPLIRSHYGVPAETIWPTVEGMKKIALAGAVDEISLGSSDLSQRFYGNPLAFEQAKNDGGVPYKDKEDLRALYVASRCGNFPGVKPYCHVTDMMRFADDCLDVGMLTGAHQAVPLFWFSELDGRGPLKVADAIREHMELVAYLAARGIPVEMNDPNQWSSRMAHDAVFVADYGLISSVMYCAGVQDMILQCQHNKPARVGDYADLAKFAAARRIAESLRPAGNATRIHLECRSGIEHFSSDLAHAKYQLARSVMLQMLEDPHMLHLVSYCEADHAATADDVIESSQIMRRAVRLFREHEHDIRRAIDAEVVRQRADYLVEEANVILDAIASWGGEAALEAPRCARIARPQALAWAMDARVMTAPCIVSEAYANPGMLTKSNRYGQFDAYASWEDETPLRESIRLARIM